MLGVLGNARSWVFEMPGAVPTAYWGNIEFVMLSLNMELRQNPSFMIQMLSSDMLNTYVQHPCRHPCSLLASFIRNCLWWLVIVWCKTSCKPTVTFIIHAIKPWALHFQWLDEGKFPSGHNRIVAMLICNTKHQLPVSKDSKNLHFN